MSYRHFPLSQRMCFNRKYRSDEKKDERRLERITAIQKG